MKKIIFISILAVLLITSCTENQRARRWGGSQTITLPKGKKLVIATWKESNLWYLTRNAKPGEVPETFEFVEDSDYGVFKGKVIFVEQ